LGRRMTIVQPCRVCGAETKHRRNCPACHAAVVYVAPKKPEREQPIKVRIKRALLDAGCMAMIHNIDNRLMHTGLDSRGVSDLICIVPPLGVFLAIEVKRPKYSPSDVSDAQRAFLAAVRHFGGVSGIASCVEDALALVDEARQFRSPPDADAPYSD
jgi:hypothetical protein